GSRMASWMWRSSIGGESLEPYRLRGDIPHLVLADHREELDGPDEFDDCRPRGVQALAAVAVADGRTLVAAGGKDAMIRCWDAATALPVGVPLAGHAGTVQALTAIATPARFTAGGDLLASGGDDGTVRLWD